jgi:hypothetical protein
MKQVVGPCESGENNDEMKLMAGIRETCCLIGGRAVTNLGDVKHSSPIKCELRSTNSEEQENLVHIINNIINAFVCIQALIIIIRRAHRCRAVLDPLLRFCPW